ncbi:hypothetical protein [Orbus wheelerorum]|uniref:hypothetical protein n=1 Tax=Orbus wheelerorum TaxID=3074111 RepID=UPI00370DCE88
MLYMKKYLLIITLLFLSGCENNQIKTVIQQGLDSQNPTGETGICFTVGVVDYPYTSHEVTGELDERGYNRFIVRNNTLNKRLALFSQLGLLSEQPAVDKDGKPTGFYHYDLTELGEKYRYFYHNNKQIFCFGRVIVDSIASKQESLTSLDTMLVNVWYNFHVEGEIPEWAKSPLLNSIRRLSKDNKAIDWSKGYHIQYFSRQKDNSLKIEIGIIPNIYGT